MPILEEIIAVLCGGALGSLLRFLVTRWISVLVNVHFPWGILAVNISGSFVMGVASGLFIGFTASPFWRCAILIGFLGGFTTFSSFSMDTVNLFHSGNYVAASVNVVLNVMGCLGATLIGLLISKAILG